MPKLKKDGTPSKQGENGGRPPKFKTDHELFGQLVNYFSLISGTNGQPKQLPNKAGLCHFLGICKDTYNEWKKPRSKFSATLKDFENIVENEWVQRLGGNSPTGAIFYLKNAFKEDYKDRTETDITSGGKKIQPILGGLSKKK